MARLSSHINWYLRFEVPIIESISSCISVLSGATKLHCLLFTISYQFHGQRKSNHSHYVSSSVAFIMRFDCISCDCDEHWFGVSGSVSAGLHLTCTITLNQSVRINLLQMMLTLFIANQQPNNIGSLFILHTTQLRSLFNATTG